MIKTLILYTGYAEDLQLTPIILTHVKGFTSFTTAIQHLSKVLYESEKEQNSYDYGCLRHDHRDGDIYCSQCGKYLVAPKVCFEVILEQWFIETGTNHPYTEALGDAGWRWWLEGNPFENPDEVAVIEERAEVWMRWVMGLQWIEEDDDTPPSSPVRTLSGKGLPTKTLPRPNKDTLRESLT